MNKAKLSAALLGCAILLSSLTTGLTGCARIKLREEGGQCVTDKGDVTYLHADACYVAVAKVEKYGKLQVSSKQSVNLHTIPDMAPEEWLADDDGYILYADTVKLPTLADMETVAVYVDTNTERVFRSAEITAAADISALVAACDAGNGLSYQPNGTATHLVRFKSDKYPGFYYSLRYIKVGDEGFLYDLSNKTSYPVGSLIDRWLTQAPATEATT